MHNTSDEDFEVHVPHIAPLAVIVIRRASHLQDGYGVFYGWRTSERQNTNMKEGLVQVHCRAKSHAVEWPKADGTAPIGATGKKLAQICGAGAKSFEVQNLAVKHQNPQKERNHARMSINSLKYNRPGRKKSVKSSSTPFRAIWHEPGVLILTPYITHSIPNPALSWSSGMRPLANPDHNAIVQFCATPPAMRKTRICKLDCLQDTSNPNTMAQHRHSRPAVPSSIARWNRRARMMHG
ncbi:hypothetical protein CIHG_01585 [Coccidioides immitis H538.4]|uniref:Uncharacterized protein n=2 Tax=Coccidioides immitis TaxID=5501 RepID=A0A0J8RGP8_COCIT|nr:hypothetical protein CIRG_01435 [Coccidioides immitis RMSCC 2394]KMU83801.1 hypothetical protein CIHG_01585 [Coccidioides immitis H538.4]